MKPRALVAQCVGALSAVGVAGLALGSSACSDPVAVGAKTEGAIFVAESVEHEPCDVKSHKVESFDARGDGRPVVTKVYDGSGHEICRISDINHDGKPDLYEYFDANGQVRRREADYDSNGTIDAVEFYEGGKLVKREYDTTGQHRVDTWDYFDKASGLRTRRERDTTNDGKVDQWWTWNGDKITIAMDLNGDGKPDPEAAVVMDDKTGKAVDPAASLPPAPPPPAAPPPPSAPQASLPPPPSPPAAPSASAPVAKAGGVK
jgi:hypothetical protein